VFTVSRFRIRLILGREALLEGSKSMNRVTKINILSSHNSTITIGTICGKKSQWSVITLLLHSLPLT
jgi:hypothetical protein